MRRWPWVLSLVALLLLLPVGPAAGPGSEWGISVSQRIGSAQDLDQSESLVARGAELESRDTPGAVHSAGEAPEAGEVGRAEVVPLRSPRPDWYTDELHQRVLAAGPRGVDVELSTLSHSSCQGVAPDGVSAGGCVVSPFGCTANFIFVDTNGNHYIGTARHCIDVGKEGGNDTGVDVVMQVASRILDLRTTVTVAKVGSVVTHTSGEGEPGNDFALIKIDPGFAVTADIPIIGGPSGVYCNSTPQAITHYGHGYGVAVEQGYPRAGAATHWFTTGYGWYGHAFPGDSGSPVKLATGASAGNLTHIIIFSLPYLPGQIAGMRMSAILDFLGTGYRLVNGSGSSSATSGGCGNGDGGGGGGTSAPTASFTYSCKGTTTCVFDGSGSSDPDGSITSYAWDFGDGTTATGAKVSHTYPNADASYVVTLVVTDNSGQTDDEKKTLKCKRAGQKYSCN